VRLTVDVDDGNGNPVPGAAVTLWITSANGRLLSGSTQTGTAGQARFTYRVNAGRDGYGTYQVTAEACKDGTCKSDETSFVVQ
jgi:protocatechuate 3,4-dioxygenase beta subunit